MVVMVVLVVLDQGAAMGLRVLAEGIGAVMFLQIFSAGSSISFPEIPFYVASVISLIALAVSTVGFFFVFVFGPEARGRVSRPKSGCYSGMNHSFDSTVSSEFISCVSTVPSFAWSDLAFARSWEADWTGQVMMCYRIFC